MTPSAVIFVIITRSIQRGPRLVAERYRYQRRTRDDKYRADGLQSLTYDDTVLRYVNIPLFIGRHHAIPLSNRNTGQPQSKGFNTVEQESPAVADKPARRLRKVCTVYVRAVRL